MADMHHINVTAEDIAWGESQNRWACALVRAIQRERPEALFVRVDAKTIGYSENGHRYTFDTPKAAIEKVIKPFDEGKHIEPITIRLPTKPTVRQVGKMTPENRQKLRDHERTRTAKEAAKARKGIPSRPHNRFCDPSEPA